MKKTVPQLDTELQLLKEGFKEYKDANEKAHDIIMVAIGEFTKMFNAKFVENGFDATIKDLKDYVDKQKKRKANTWYFWLGVAKQVLTSVIVLGIGYYIWTKTGFSM